MLNVLGVGETDEHGAAIAIALYCIAVPTSGHSFLFRLSLIMISIDEIIVIDWLLYCNGS